MERESYPLLSTAEAITLKLHPLPIPAGIRYSLRRGKEVIFRLHVGCSNTQWYSGISSPASQGPGYDEWHTTTKSEITVGAKKLGISPWPLNHSWLASDNSRVILTVQVRGQLVVFLLSCWWWDLLLHLYWWVLQMEGKGRQQFNPNWSQIQ